MDFVPLADGLGERFQLEDTAPVVLGRQPQYQITCTRVGRKHVELQLQLHASGPTVIARACRRLDVASAHPPEHFEASAAVGSAEDTAISVEPGGEVQVMKSGTTARHRAAQHTACMRHKRTPPPPNQTMP